MTPEQNQALNQLLLEKQIELLKARCLVAQDVCEHLLGLRIVDVKVVKIDPYEINLRNELKEKEEAITRCLDLLFPREAKVITPMA